MDLANGFANGRVSNLGHQTARTIGVRCLEASKYKGPNHRSRAATGVAHLHVPESIAQVLPADVTGLRVAELGCGTGHVSAWLSRAGAHRNGLEILDLIELYASDDEDAYPLWRSRHMGPALAR